MELKPFQNEMQTTLHLIIFFLIIFAILKASTLGWRFTEGPFMDLTKNTRLSQKLRTHAYKLSREIGDRNIYEHEGLDKAATYITETFQSYGYDVEFQEYSSSGAPVKNIIATRIGAQRPEEIVIVGAHYDSCFNPGADDNASAVAGLLELAKLIRDKLINRSIRLIAFVNEEPPFFQTEDMGSAVYANAAKARGEDIKAALILEMIGYYSDRPHSQRYPPIYGLFYPNKGNFIAVVGNLASRRLTEEIVSNFKSHSHFPIESIISFGFIPGADFSDHWSFWKEGYPAVMITDTAFYRNPHYHGRSDTYEKLNYESTAEVVRGLGAVLIDLAR